MLCVNTAVIPELTIFKETNKGKEKISYEINRIDKERKK